MDGSPMAESGPLTVTGLATASLRVFARAPLFFLALSAVPLLSGPIAGLHALPPPLLSYRAGLDAIIAQLLTGLVQAPMLARTAQLIGHRDPSWRALRDGLPGRVLPVLVTAVLQFALTTLGFLLLVLPGLIAGAALVAATPACLHESLGPIRSLQRSRAMTEGSRLRIFWGATLLSLPYVIVAFVIGLQAALASGNGFPGRDYVSDAMTALMTAWTTIFAGVAYHDLRRGEHGSAYAEVFA